MPFGADLNPKVDIFSAYNPSDPGQAGWYIGMGLGIHTDEHLYVNYRSLQSEIIATAVPAPVPAPATLPLFAIGLVLMGWFERRKKRTEACISPALPISLLRTSDPASSSLLTTGVVAGAVGTSENRRPAIWIDGIPTQLGSNLGGFGVANAINNVGQIVGEDGGEVFTQPLSGRAPLLPLSATSPALLPTILMMRGRQRVHLWQPISRYALVRRFDHVSCSH